MTEDYIDAKAADTASTIEQLVVPARDGLFVCRVVAKHRGTNTGTPTMSMRILINGQQDYASKTIAWQDGPAEHHDSTMEFLKEGKEYRFRAESSNQNATAEGITMDLKRLNG